MFRPTRRRFLKSAAAALAAPWLISSSALGADGRPPPSNRVALGFIGVGMMGQGHVGCCTHFPEVEILAVCDVDTWRREHAKAAVDQAYARLRPGAASSGCRAYNDLRELLARDDLDAVLIATGDRWHAAATILAAKAGKDVYCEKPVSLTVRGARAMVQAVRRYGRVFQSGLQQRSDATFRTACDLVRAGALGAVRAVYVNHPGTCGDVTLPAEPVPDGLDWDLWLGPAPARPYNSRFHPYGQPKNVVPWHFCRDFGGGNLTSNAVHAFDTVQWALGMDASGPVEITPPETGRVPVLTYTYASGVVLRVVNGRIDRATLQVPEGWDDRTPITPFGALFVGDKGWIHVGRGSLIQSHPAAILQHARAESGPERPAPSHHQNWLDSIRSRRRTACDVAVGCQSTIVSHLGCIAHWTRRALKWDPVKETFLADDEADRWLGRAMRPPWTL